MREQIFFFRAFLVLASLNTSFTYGRAAGSQAPLAKVTPGRARALNVKPVRSRELPFHWHSAQGVDIGPAGAYEAACRAKGIVPDPARIDALVGGDPVHYRLHETETGLRYLSIHCDRDDEQVFSERIYGGIGEVHGPKYKFYDEARGTDLGDGYQFHQTSSYPKKTKDEDIDYPATLRNVDAGAHAAR